MKYMLLVSHGMFAKGLADALQMLVGPKKELLACGLKENQSIDGFANDFSMLIKDIPVGSELVVLGDLIGGSPLTNATSILMEKGFTETMVVMGGMNLPLAVTVALMKDSLSKEELVVQVTKEAREALKDFRLVKNYDDEDI
jgi:PTS system N-acetylgalactosamine-specific IIA component